MLSEPNKSKPSETVVSGVEKTTPMKRRKLLKYAGWGTLGLIIGAFVHDKPITGKNQSLAQSIGVEPEKLLTYSFDVITVNERGKETYRENKQAKYFPVDLGNNITLDMVWIPGGNFIMGSPDTEMYRNNDESPQHEVTIPPFYMGKYQVTQAQWEAVMGNNPSYFKGANKPVETVSWDDCMAFCAKLSQKTGLTFTLPSEAQWEYACRAGTTGAFHFGTSITSNLANYNGHQSYVLEPKGIYRQRTTQVGSFPPNSFGLYDMHGNLWEWCQDDWHENYLGAPNDGSAWMNANHNQKILRGGSWYPYAKKCRSAYRNYNYRGVKDNHYGFRVVCVVKSHS